MKPITPTTLLVDPPPPPPIVLPQTGLYARYSAIEGVFVDVAGTMPAADGQAVAHWADLSGNGRPLTMPDSSANLRPAYRTDQLNGLPLIDFDGVDDRLNGEGQGWEALHTLAAVTIYAVLIPKINSAPDVSFGMLCHITAFNTGGQTIIGGHSGVLSGETFMIGTNGSNRRLGTTTTDFPFAAGVPMRFSASVGASGTTVFKDGQPVSLSLVDGSSSTSQNFSPQAAGVAPNAILRVGAFLYSAPTFFARYKLAELIVYSVQHDGDQGQAVNDYLADRWGV